MLDINWNNFKSKFNERERSSFERLAYMLFCYEFHIRIGIFRFKNQTGIETEPIDVDGSKVGFQAKYFDTKISENKDDIIDSLRKAKSKNPLLNKILIYTNQELSESSTKTDKKPVYLTDIEQAAANTGVEIDWRLPSHFEKQLSVPENNYLANYFFELGTNAVDFLDKFKAHSQNILFAIQTDIQFNGQRIKVDRQNDLLKLTDNKTQIIILAGEGGSGKTALIKELFSNNSIPYYILKAAEFTKQSSTAIFNQFGAYDMNDFLQFHEDETRKIFVVDSAEKLSDLENQDVFIELLSALIKHEWQIIFTTRNSYLDDLCFQMIEVYKRSFDVIKLKNLDGTELENLSTNFHFKIPHNPRLQSLISNLFYLSEYLANYDMVNEQTDVAKFRDILWQKKIQNTKFKKDNIHLERNRCFLSLAKQRCDTGSFFLSGDSCQNEVLSLLEKDEIIKHDPTQDLYFITHDIYEEWALEKLIEKEYASLVSHVSFFENIGNSLAIRRAFRDWLSNKIFQSDSDIKQFVEQSFSQDVVPGFWKDELLISVLLSDYSIEFFRLFHNVLLANDKFFLKKIIFLLRTACKELDAQLSKLLQNKKDLNISPAYVFTKPKGKGWDATIEYIYSKITLIQIEELDFILPLLKEWVDYQPTGNTGKIAGLFALHFYKDSELNKDIYYSSESEKQLLQIVLATAAELKPELTAITEELLVQPFNKRVAFDSLRDAVLASGYDSTAYIMNMPEYVIRLADSSWQEVEVDDHPYYSSGMGVEKYYGIKSQYHSHYFPPSALQTPIHLLLHANFVRTIDFILDFTNRAVDAYFASGFDKDAHEIEVYIGSGKTKQIISHCLWSMYRGSGSPVTPYLLQSMHMALEKKLLQIGKLPDKAIVKSWLYYILENARSASLTAIVTSIVLAYPDDLFDIALVLFENYEFYKYDNVRASTESQAKRLYSISSGPGRKENYTNERLASCNDPHRNSSLETIALNYQWFKNEQVSNEEADRRKEEIWKIIDGFHNTIAPEDAETEKNKILRLFLARIDRRKMNPVVHEEKDRLVIEFNPSLEPDLKEYSEAAKGAFNDGFKHTTLKLWAVSKVEKNKEYGPYTQYDQSPDLVLKETKEILDNLHQEGGEGYDLMNGSIPGYTCAALLRFYADQLSDEEKLFCGGVVMAYATFPFKEGYDYQIGDGVEAATSAIPSLYKLFPDDRPDFNQVLLFLLFDTYPLGEYKRICDYAIEAVRDDLFANHPDDANIILVAYMLFKPKFDLDNTLQRMRMEQRTRPQMLQEFITKYEKELENIEQIFQQYDKVDFSAQGIWTAETAFQLMPSETTNPVHLDYIKKLLTNFSSELLKETKYSNDCSEVDHRLKHRFYTKYSTFLLYREVTDITEWVQPFVNAFTLTREMADFLSDVILEEDRLGKYESFWAIWECFYPVIKAAAGRKRYHYLDDIIRNYMLAWPYWQKTAKEWRSLRDREAVFFQRICTEIGHHPSVLYSISKLLNEIGSPFLDKGIIWIADLLSKHTGLATEEIHPNTIYYLEVIVRKYVYLNRTKLKSDRYKKEKVLTILDFLVAKGSVNGYLLREDIF